MPRVIYSPEFIADLVKIKDFLDNLESGIHAKFAARFRKKLQIIKTMPKAFLPFGDNRIYFLSFGSSGYAIQYYFDENFDTIKLLRIKHQKEAGF
jgi:mRNA-degrading endonuclease RelE of RelBE toxin-antitoxin system